MDLGQLERPNPVLPSPGNHGFHREIIPFYGRKIEVGELVQFTQLDRAV